MFIVMNVIHHVSRGSKLKVFDFIILLSANLFFYGIGIYLLEDWGFSSYKGLLQHLLESSILYLLIYFSNNQKRIKTLPICLSASR